VQIPASWDEVTPGWMTEVLAGRFPGAAVIATETIWRSDGNNRRAKFHLTYSDEKPAAAPDVVFVKAEGPYREVHAQNGNLFNEALILGSGLPLMVDNAEPYAVIIDKPTLDWLVVMEDVTQRDADPRDATRPMTVEQARNGVRGLARMHRRYWDLSNNTPPELDWLQTWEATEGFTGALRGRADRGLERMAGQLPAELDGLTGDDLVDLCARYLTLLGRGPTTLLHGDAHIGNSFVTRDGDVGFIDWQVTRGGNWSQDVGYFIQGALVETECRTFERELVEAYRLELDRDLTKAECWTWYCASPLYGLPVWLATLGSDRGSQPVDIASALSRRHAAAMVALDSAGALAELERGG
jgi:hypothetical protein